MGSTVIPVILGIVCVLLGVSNMKGNIASIHWYHRQRVAEEDRIPFGKKMGIGTVVIGISVIVFSILSLAAEALEADFLIVIGSVIIAMGIGVGVALSVYAMIKYNKGIF